MNIDPADVLAVLEERPYEVADLAAVFDASADAVRVTLKAMKRDGLVKQVGTAQLWALVSFIGEPGRKPVLDRDACRAAILAAVQYGPVPTSTIVSVSGFSRTTVKDELQALLQGGQLQHLGASRGSTWALPGWAPPTVDVSADVDEADDDVAGELEPDDTETDDTEPDPDAELVEFDPPPQRVRGQRALYPAGTRQPAAKKAPVETAPGWWVKHAGPDQRDAFMAAAAERDAEMREKSSAWRSQTRPNS